MYIQLDKNKTTMKNTKELWNDIPGWEGMYQISTLGRVKSVDRIVSANIKSRNVIVERNMKGTILSPNRNNCDYLWIRLSRKGCKAKRYFIHHLVAQCFHQNPELKKYVNHKDGNKNNNSASNLEWCTARENIRHSMENGFHRFHNNRQFAMIDVETNSIIGVYKYLTDVYEEYGVRVSAISVILSGKGKTACKKKYTFEYID